MSLRAIRTRRPKNMSELKLFYEEDWSKIPPEFCAAVGLRFLLPNDVQAVVNAKGSLTFATRAFIGVFRKKHERLELNV